MDQIRLKKSYINTKVFLNRSRKPADFPICVKVNVWRRWTWSVTAPSVESGYNDDGMTGREETAQTSLKNGSPQQSPTVMLLSTWEIPSLWWWQTYTQRHINSISMSASNSHTLRLELPGEQLQQTECVLKIYAEKLTWREAAVMWYISPN